MKKVKNGWEKILVIIAIIAVIIFGGGYLGLQILKSILKDKISGCELKSSNFKSVIDFEYVNNWIIIKAKVAGSDKEYPFWFDTGAQTVIMDSLLKEISRDNYENFSFGSKSDSNETAFNSQLISLKSLQLGDVKFQDIGSLTAKNSKWGMLNCVSAYGIIGYNVIQTGVFQIDYEKKQITITDNAESLINFKEIQWVNYKSSMNQETPIIQAKFNDSINIDLFFDTGNSGGIILSSEQLYQAISQQFPEQTVKYESIPSLLIRGEKNEIGKSLIFKASNFYFANNLSEKMTIQVSNKPEREFEGIIGNKYFENYIVTLDYRNKRVGFISEQKREEDNSTFGISYLPYENKIFVSAIYDGYLPYLAGIKPGDEIYSLNGFKICDLPSELFCKLYRNEYSFENEKDSLLKIGIMKGDSLIDYQFKKQKLF